MKKHYLLLGLLLCICTIGSTQIFIGDADCYDPTMTQDEVDDMADGTMGSPFATWRAALEFAQMNNITTIEFIAGTYTTDNSVFNAFSLANGGHPVTLAGMTINGNGSTIINASGASTAGFANIQANNVTLNDINLLEFGQALTIEDVTNFNYNTGIVDGSDNGGLNGVEINSDATSTDATFTGVDFNNHDTPNFTSAMDILSSSTTTGINTTVTFNDCDWNCNVRDGFGGALFIGHGGSRSPGDVGPIVNMNGGGFYGNDGLGNASDGGALNVQDNAVLTIDGTEFVCNTTMVMDGTAGGGAIRIQGGADVTIMNANFSNNSSTQYGGAILFNVNTGDPGLTISNTEFHNNTADRGGAVYLSDETTTTITGCYFSTNNGVGTGFGGNGGGGIFIDGGGNTSLTVENTSILANTTNDSGAGGINFENASGSDELNIVNSVICNNTTSDITSSATVNVDANSVIGVGDGNQGDCAAIPAGVGYQGAPAAIACPACPDPPSTPDDCSFVPVELLEFLVTVDDCKANLQWLTASELDNSHFHLQRSFDNKTFENIAKIEGAGTTVELQRYSYTDNIEQSAYYRLEQVDFSGDTHLSETIFADASKCKGDAITIAPNPTSSDLLISMQSSTTSVQVNIFDIQGKLVYSNSFDANIGTTNILIPTSDLANGMHILEIMDSNIAVERLRFIKQ